MAASEHLSPKLFHGTSHYFKDDETITPMNIGSSYSEGLKAFVSTSFEEAQEAAGHRAYKASTLFSPVYEVSPTGDTERVGDGNIVSSSFAFKPKSIVGWGMNPLIGKK